MYISTCIFIDIITVRLMTLKKKMVVNMVDRKNYSIKIRA